MSMRLLQILLKLHTHINHPLKVSISQSLTSVKCQLHRRLDSVSNLAAIEVIFCQDVDLVFELVDICVGVGGAQAIEEVVPYLPAPLSVEGGVVQGQLNAGFEGFIEKADTIGREDKDSLVDALVLGYWDS